MLIDIFGVDLVYNDVPFTDVMISLITIVFIIITYKFRKIFPFNIIWGFLVIVFIYAMLNYIGGWLKKRIKE